MERSCYGRCLREAGPLHVSRLRMSDHFHVAHPRSRCGRPMLSRSGRSVRMERRERVERSNAGFAVQPLTVCCCGDLVTNSWWAGRDLNSHAEGTSFLGLACLIPPPAHWEGARFERMPKGTGVANAEPSERYGL